MSPNSDIHTSSHSHAMSILVSGPGVSGRYFYMGSCLFWTWCFQMLTSIQALIHLRHIVLCVHWNAKGTSRLGNQPHIPQLRHSLNSQIEHRAWGVMVSSCYEHVSDCNMALCAGRWRVIFRASSSAAATAPPSATTAATAAPSAATAGLPARPIIWQLHTCHSHSRCRVNPSLQLNIVGVVHIFKQSIVQEDRNVQIMGSVLHQSLFHLALCSVLKNQAWPTCINALREWVCVANLHLRWLHAFSGGCTESRAQDSLGSIYVLICSAFMIITGRHCFFHQLQDVLVSWGANWTLKACAGETGPSTPSQPSAGGSPQATTEPISGEGPLPPQPPSGGGAPPSGGSSGGSPSTGGQTSSGGSGAPQVPPSGTTDYRGSDPIGSDTKGSDTVGNGGAPPSGGSSVQAQGPPAGGSSGGPPSNGGPTSGGGSGAPQAPPSGTTDYRGSDPIGSDTKGSDPVGSDTKGSDPIGNGKGWTHHWSINLMRLDWILVLNRRRSVYCYSWSLIVMGRG